MATKPTLEEVTLTFDPEDLTATEIYWVEDYVGKTLQDLVDDFSIKAAVAFVYVIKKRSTPDLEVTTVENLKLSEILGFLGNGTGSETS